MNNTKSQIFKRFIIYALGLMILCFGVVLNTKTNLGVAAINVIPYVFANTTNITLGTAVFILYCILIILQCLIKQKIELLVILQLPVSLLFGRMVDFINIKILNFSAGSWIEGVIMLIIAINLVAIGTTFVVEQRLVPNAPDGFVQALADKIGWIFGKTKVCFDVLFVGLAAGLSMFLAGSIIGIGIGTLASMIFTGLLCAKYRQIIYRK